MSGLSTNLPRPPIQSFVPAARSSALAERIAFVVGGLLIISGLAHLVVLVVSGGSWSGPLSWRKPTTFGVSFGLTLITITWVSRFLDLRQRTRIVLIAAFTAACTSETLLVTLQTWRGRPSHFNMETPFDALIARALAAGGLVLVVVIVLLTIAAFRSRPSPDSSLLVAVRAGFVALVGAQLVGVAMIATGMQLVLRGDPQAAYASGGFLKPTHAVLMHGILLLPLLAWFLSLVDWAEERRRAALFAATACYALIVGATAVSNLGERRLGAAEFPTKSLLLIGTVSCVAVTLVTVVRIARTTGTPRDGARRP